MARFQDHELPDGTAPQTAWATVKKHLLGAETVEVVVRYDADDNPTAIVLRVWDDVRKDDSNSADADPDADY
jgi:hypothetical protein